MIVTYSPRRMNVSLTYSFGVDVVVATLGNKQDVFNFAAMPDGEAGDITSVLDPCPVLAARRVDGELHVTLLRAVPARPADPQELDAWKSLWTDVEEVVSGG